MSDFRVGVLIEGDSTGGVRALDQTAKASQNASSATSKMGQTAAKTGTQTQALRRAEDQAAAAARKLAAANAAAATTATQMGAANAGGARHVANLTAQFNDIGVMLASGQNPLQLALQQGTQITQVIGPMGAAGAAKALSGAFVSMINPMSLVTLGTIAGGAALFQWGRNALSASDDGRTFEETLDDLTTAVGEYKELSDLAASSTSALQERFGSAGRQASAAAGFLAEFARVDAINEVDAAVAQLTERFGGLSREDLVGFNGRPVVEILATLSQLEDELGLTEAQSEAVILSLEGLANAGTMAEKVEAANKLNAAFVRVFGSVENIPIQLLEVAKEAALVALQVGEIEGAVEGSLAAMVAMADNERLLGEQMSLTYQQMQENETIAGLMRDGIKASVVQAMQLAGVDMTAPISAANMAAAELASNLGIAFEQARRNLALQSQMSYSGRGGDPRDSRFVPTQETLDAYNEMNRPTPARTGGRGGASAADAERKAVDDLLSSLNQEVAILRELDPVQQELIRHREVLGAATTEERETVEQLIMTRERERVAMELAQENMAAWKDATGGILDELIRSGGDLESVFDSVTSMLLQMVQQALLLGEGPLASLFGTAGGGGALDTFFSSLAGGGKALPAKAEGGMIYGPGSGTSDDVLMWGSSGEFVMNAKATQKHRHLLEAMNSGGGVPGFATGGMIGSGPAAPAGFGGVNISIENRGSAPITGEVQEQSDGAGGRKLTLVLADQVGAALTTKGGGARRALMNNYGVRPMGSKR